MRLIKMLGLAMVAAVAAMAFIGAGSASASTTALCKANELPCASGNQYASGTEFVGKSTSTILLTPLGSYVCTSSEVKGKTTSGLGASVSGEITAMSITGCTLNGEKCTFTPEGLPYKASVLTTSGTMNGVMTVTELSVSLSECLNCTFGFSSVALDVLGGSPATVHATEEKLTREEGFFCPGESKWDALYTVSPSPLFLAA